MEKIAVKTQDPNKNDDALKLGLLKEFTYTCSFRCRIARRDRH